MLGCRAVVIVLLVSSAPNARADGADRIPGHSVDGQLDMSITLGAVTAALGAFGLPDRGHAPWETDRPGDDIPFSATARRISDVTLAASIAAPLAYLTGPVVEDADGDRLTIYSETLAVDLALVQTVKYLIQRPRPYTYSNDPAVQRYAHSRGRDAYASFYSSHASMSFGAATAGAYLLSASGASPAVRGTVWATGFATATMTSLLRLKSGQHFLSDVIVGALVGVAVGYVVPALHADRGKAYKPSMTDADCAGAGMFAGLLASELVPAKKLHLDKVSFVPMMVPNGSGLAVTARLR